jgi:hypothetical protein
MCETARQDNASGFLDKAQLIQLKLKAMRSGAWFRTLLRIDRVLVDLTIRMNTNVRSCTLAKSIFSVARKLQDVVESKLARAIREFGFPLVCKLSLFAQKWGHEGAWEWVNEPGFARYLAVMKLNG